MAQAARPTARLEPASPPDASQDRSRRSVTSADGSIWCLRRASGGHDFLLSHRGVVGTLVA
eukprot:7640957-Alexandrium_andersonii.AAC.1